LPAGAFQFNNKLRGANPMNNNVSNLAADLKTPTDLKIGNIKEVTLAINALVADAFALYIKTKNFHWHLSGPNFRDFHVMLDEQATQIFDSIDPLAERVRKLGGTTIRSISHIAKLQSLKDNNDEYVTPLEMLAELQADNQMVAKNMRSAHKVCDDNDDFATSSLLEIYIDETERRLWFLFESSRSADSTGH
jgi:starvation-inducible DNA-binding protein